MNPPAVDIVPIRRMPVELHDVLPPAERVQHLEGGIVAPRRVGVQSGPTDHGLIYGHHSFPVGGHQAAEIFVWNRRLSTMESDRGGGAVAEVAVDLRQRGHGLAAGAGEAADSF